MIFLKNNYVNEVVLTLREKSLYWTYSSITPYYLFNFNSPTTNENIYFTSTNISPLSAQDSYDKFIIITTGRTSINYSAGTIYLNPAIFWNYNVYEQYPSEFNFDPGNCLSLVEKGKVLFSSATHDFQYLTVSGDTNYIVANRLQ